MKKTGIALIATLAMITPTFANVEGTIQGDIMLLNDDTPIIYDSLEELLANEENVTSVTDGCNTGIVGENGEVTMTLMYCEDIYGEDGNITWYRTDGYVQPVSKTFYADGKTPTQYDSLEDLLKNEKNVTSITDGCNTGFVTPNGDAAMTMMYCEDVYGKDGKTTWYRTDAQIFVPSEDSDYVDEDMFVSLYTHKNLNSLVTNILSGFSNSMLESLRTSNIDMIDSIKRQRIAGWVQVEKITQIYYLNTLINEILAQ